jgi:hypothetical protein
VTQGGFQAGCVFSSEEAIGVIKKIGSRRGRLMCWIRCVVSLFLTFLTVPPLPSFSSSFPFPFLLLPVSSQSSLLLPLPPLFLPLRSSALPQSLYFTLYKKLPQNTVHNNHQRLFRIRQRRHLQRRQRGPHSERYERRAVLKAARDARAYQ